MTEALEGSASEGTCRIAITGEEDDRADSKTDEALVG